MNVHLASIQLILLNLQQLNRKEYYKEWKSAERLQNDFDEYNVKSLEKDERIAASLEGQRDQNSLFQKYDTMREPSPFSVMQLNPNHYQIYLDPLRGNLINIKG